MKKEMVTRTLNRLAESIQENPEYSLGFNRLQSMPNKARHNFELKFALRNFDAAQNFGDYHLQAKSHLQNLSDEEFIIFLNNAN